ncbi:SRPBCC family protein [Dactylosporangium sp. CA-139066]|uniref:SRPBCC family protein n=1 Tax=Dactylosporangium sp. CA-139066 TaxID=3239930 RepID=UPI003D8BEE15
MSTARESIEVAVPVAVAYEQLTHFENYSQFMSGIMSLAPIDASTAHMVLDIGGNRAEFDARITETRTDEFLCWEAMDGPQVIEALRLEPMADDMTRVIAELQIDARELMPSEQHAAEVLNRRLKSDLKGFKRFCEEAAAKAAEAEEPAEEKAEKKPRPSVASIARGIASASGLTHPSNERPVQPAPPNGNLGPMQHADDHSARLRQQHDL